MTPTITSWNARPIATLIELKQKSRCNMRPRWSEKNGKKIITEGGNPATTHQAPPYTTPHLAFPDFRRTWRMLADAVFY